MLYGAAELAFPDDPFRVGIAGWSWAHGFASLWVSGSYGRGVGHDDPIELARSIGEVLFRLPD
jgi:hypothetical protein